MTFVITSTCCSDASCIPVCPVQCIRPRPEDPDFTTAEQLYIDPSICIDCAACQEECPVAAIYPEFELPEELEDYLEVNADYFADSPIEESTAPDPVRHSLPAGHGSLRVAIVGTGPAGCYAADELSQIAGVSVTVFDRLPTPFGLVRAGVAPDHPDTKQITGLFGRVLSRPNVRCAFNVEVGGDLTLDELRETHHAVIWAGGASSDRPLNIPGEGLAGCVSAREFVAWYNGHPDHADRSFDLSGEQVVVIGNGNVALDVARVLVQPNSELRRTEMADHALAALDAHGVRDVIITARRGPEHAACTSGELAELARVEDVVVCAEPDELAGVDTSLRRVRLLGEAADRNRAEAERGVTFRFGLTPTEILDGGTGAVAAVAFARADGEAETIPTSLVIKAIGYRGLPVEGLGFDADRGTFAHDSGRVLQAPAGAAEPGLYCSGWIKRGATGTIGTNRVDARETVESLLADLAAGLLPEPRRTTEELAGLLAERVPELVDREAWGRIDRAEREAGAAQRRPRIKFTTVEELLAAARN